MTTTGNFMSEDGVRNAQDVIARMQGYRTPRERIKEYYGIQDADFTNTKKLKMAGVAHTKRLAELGITKDMFEEMFADVLDFNTKEDEPKSSNTGSTDGSTEESVIPSTDKGTRNKKG